MPFRATSTVRTSSLSQVSGEMGKVLASISNQGTRAAIRKAANVILKPAKANCPVDTGTLRDSLIVKVVQKKGIISAFIGISKSATGPFVKGVQRIPKFYASLTEFGCMHKTDFGIAIQQPQPYMRPAFDSNKEEAIKVFLDEIGAQIEKRGSQYAMNNGLEDDDEFKDAVEGMAEESTSVAEDALEALI